ncbi:hypothetical protein NliqN6_4342 [Naganishia liquefaciens]|uniref:Uncharacterized protein n=1 Tax=Naganishia liquefaciens TaxID=104408 RepID=A0A8H3YFP1_9TREE|nr:hypothetical protein NliqN6_4342 [Naganishia liquefaciens]
MANVASVLEGPTADSTSSPSPSSPSLGMDDKQKTIAIIVLLAAVAILMGLSVYLAIHTCAVKRRLTREIKEQADIDAKVADTMKREVEQQSQNLMQMSQATMARNLGNPYLEPSETPVEKKRGWFWKK